MLAKTKGTTNAEQEVQVERDYRQATSSPNAVRLIASRFVFKVLNAIILRCLFTARGLIMHQRLSAGKPPTLRKKIVTPNIIQR
jgi:hypothetical protein